MTDENKFIIPISELCGILELSCNTQVRRIKLDPALAIRLFYVRTIVLRADDSPQTHPITCLWLNYLPYWLGYIDTQLVKPELQDKISKFKLELANMAWPVYHSQILPAEILRQLDATRLIKA